MTDDKRREQKAKILKKSAKYRSIESKVDFLNTSAWELLSVDFQLAKEINDKVFDVLKAGKYRYGFAYAYLIRGKIHYRSFEFQHAIINYKRAHGFLDDSPRDKKMLIRIYSSLGSACMDSGRLKEALDYLLTGLEAGRKSGDKELILDIYFGLSGIEYLERRFESSLVYAEEAYELAAGIKNKSQSARALNNMGALCVEMGKYDRALEYLNAALVIADRKKNFLFKATTLDEIGMVYHKLGETGKALEYLNQALDIFTRQGVDQYMPDLLLHMSEILLGLGLYSEAAKKLDSAIKLAGEKKALRILREGYYLLSVVREKEGDIRAAYEAHKQFHHFNEEIVGQETIKRVKGLEADTYKKANEKIKSISKIGRIITSSIDLKEVLDIIYSNIKKLLSADIFGIAVLDRSGKSINYELFVENGLYYKPFYSDIDDPDSFAAWSVRNNQDIFLNDMESDYHQYISSVSYHEEERDEPEDYPQSVLCTPSRFNEKVIGVMMVESYKKNAYSISDMDSFSALSSYVSIALNNAGQADLIREQNDQLRQLSGTDLLTGAGNRKSFHLTLERYWNLCRRKNLPLSLLKLDADRLKKISAAHGQPAGDAVLSDIAELIKKAARRKSDIFSRDGGEEFALWLFDTPYEAAVQLAESIRKEQEKSACDFNGTMIACTLSIGVSEATPAEDDKDGIPEFIKRADDALYRAVKKGGNRVEGTGV